MTIPEVFHRLGTVLAVLTAVLCTVAAVGEARRRRAVRSRARTLLGRKPADHGLREGSRSKRRRLSGSPAGRWRGRARQWWGPLGTAGFVALLVGGVTGVAVGLAAGYGAHRWRTRQRTAEAEQLALTRVREELAPAGDLLAACLAAGAGPQASAEAVGHALGGTVGARLRQVAAELRLGGEPAVAWARLAELPGAGALARCMERAGISGAPAVAAASRVAAELRAEWGRAATGRTRRAGVLVTLPLAACFLPAFLVLGVAPVLYGLASGLLAHN